MTLGATSAKFFGFGIGKGNIDLSPLSARPLRREIDRTSWPEQIPKSHKGWVESLIRERRTDRTFLALCSKLYEKSFALTPSTDKVVQGVGKFLPQLCWALASAYVDKMKYPLNHVIYTSREFFWHMKHHGIPSGHVHRVETGLNMILD